MNRRRLIESDQAIAASGNSDQETLPIHPVSKVSPKRRNVNRKVGTSDKCVWPDPSHQLFFADQFARPFEQRDQTGRLFALQKTCTSFAFAATKVKIVEDAAPEQFFTAASSERAKEFLSKILAH